MAPTAPPEKKKAERGGAFAKMRAKAAGAYLCANQPLVWDVPTKL